MHVLCCISEKNSLIGYMNKFFVSLLLGTITVLNAQLPAVKYSKPVGVETHRFGTGFTYIGIRHLRTEVAKGTILSVSPTSVSVGHEVNGTLISGKTYVLEIENAKGVIQAVENWSLVAGETVITTPSDLTSEITAGITTYRIRPASSLASIFGTSNLPNSSGEPVITLAAGNGGHGGADQIWIKSDGVSYHKYYFDNFAPPSFNDSAWVEVGGEAVSDPDSIIILPGDALVISSQNGGGSFAVGGVLKTTPTEVELNAGFSILSNLAPVGQSLQSAFPDGHGLAHGAGGASTATEVWLPLQNGTFDKYYWDAYPFDENWNFLDAGWVKIGQVGTVDGSVVQLGHAYIIHSQSAGNLTQQVPSFYSGL